MSARTAKAIYRVTASESPEVPVGKFIIDYDQGKIGYWHLFDAAEASFKNGWTGVRTHKLCRACLDLPDPKVVGKGHAGDHGEAPQVNPMAAS